MWSYRAEVARVVDGDTLDLMVDLGFDVHVLVRVRLAGVNAPERGTVQGAAARAFVVDWCAGAGRWVSVQTSKAGAREKYGRWLAEVFAEDGRGLVADLLAAGHAVAWDGRGPRPV